MAAATLPLRAKTKTSGTGAPSSLKYGELGTDGTSLWVGNSSETPVLMAAASTTAYGEAATYTAARTTSDVSIAIANTFYDACSLTLPAGKYLLIGTVVCGRTTTTAAQYTAKLWDGTTVYDAGAVAMPSLNPHYVDIPLTAVVTFTAETTVRMSATSNQTGVIKYIVATNGTGTGDKTTQLQAIRLDNIATPAGLAKKRAFAETTTRTSTTSEIPYDDSAPTSSEGAELLTLGTFIPTSGANKVRVHGRGNVTAGGALGVVFALFRGTTCIAANAISVPGADSQLRWEIDAETTVSSGGETLSLRWGRVGGAGTAWVNGSSTVRVFGGVQRCTLEAIEYTS